jgi:hypothetical protein
MQSKNIVNRKDIEMSYSELEMKVVQWGEALSLIHI